MVDLEMKRLPQLIDWRRRKRYLLAQFLPQRTYKYIRAVMKITYKSYREGLEKTIANFLKAKTMTHAAREPDAKLQH